MYIFELMDKDFTEKLGFSLTHIKLSRNSSALFIQWSHPRLNTYWFVSKEGNIWPSCNK